MFVSESIIEESMNSYGLNSYETYRDEFYLDKELPKKEIVVKKKFLSKELIDLEYDMIIKMRDERLTQDKLKRGMEFLKSYVLGQELTTTKPQKFKDEVEYVRIRRNS